MKAGIIEMNAASRLLMAATALALALVGCGGGGGGGVSGGGTSAAPTISSFSAALSSIPSGGSTTLTAVFANGIGTIDRSVGTVQSGVPVGVSPATATTYTLTVTNSAGAWVSAPTMVTVTQPPSPVVLTFGTASLPYSGTVAVNSNGYYQITGLTPGDRYAFNVTATNYPLITYYRDAYQTQIKCASKKGVSFALFSWDEHCPNNNATLPPLSA